MVPMVHAKKGNHRTLDDVDANNSVFTSKSGG